MKKLVLLVFSLFLTSGMLLAQDISVDSEYCIMLNEKVYHYQKNGVSLLREDLTLNDGTVVNPDGKLKLKNGKSAKLEDGECIGMSGKRYKDQAALNKKLLSKK
jgi:hypothetical protein